MRKRDISGYLFIAPNLIGVIIFFVIPFLFAFVLAFSNWNHLQGLSTLKFVGFENFKRLFTDVWFIDSFRNNLVYSFIGVPIAIFIAIVLAPILNDKVFGKSILRACYFVPYITNGIAIAFVWMLLFQPRLGPINGFLRTIGIENPPEWLASTTWALPALIIINVWATIGYNIIIYVAALQGISREIYEACDIDGASGVRKFFSITMPLLTPSTFFLLTTGLITSFKVFGIIQALTQGGPVRSTSVLGYYIYLTAFRYYDMGYASAISWVLFALIFIVTLVQFKLQKHWVNY